MDRRKGEEDEITLQGIWINKHMYTDKVWYNWPWSPLWRERPCSPFSAQLSGWSGRHSASDSAAPMFPPGLCSTQCLEDSTLIGLLLLQHYCTFLHKEEEGAISWHTKWCSTSVKGLEVIHGLVNGVHLVASFLQNGAGTEHCSMGLHGLQGQVRRERRFMFVYTTFCGPYWSKHRSTQAKR